MKNGGALNIAKPRPLECPRRHDAGRRIATLEGPMRAFFLDPATMNLELRDAPKPQPAANQMLVRVRAAGLNRGEFLKHGLTKPGPAKIGGTEGAGEVEKTGERAEGIAQEGMRVMGRLPASFAEYALMDTSDAAGVGVAALLAGKVLGAKVAGTSGSADKLARLKSLGLDLAIQTRKPDFSRQVLEATGGKGVNLVVNNVGGSMFAECVKSLGYEGRLATVGYVDGVMHADMDIEALHSKRLRLFGVSNKMRNAAQRGVTVEGFKKDFLPLFATGKLKPLIDRVYDFKDLPAAKARMQADAHVGKIVVRI